MPENNKTLWPIDKLDNWQRNPRKMDEAGKLRLKAQLLKLQQYKPLLIVIDGERGIVLGGNMRLTSMRELANEGHEQFRKVWVSVVDAPDDKTKLEYALSDNDTIGTYEKRDLYEMVMEIPEFNLEGYHIDSGNSMDLEGLVDRFRETKEDKFDAAKEAKKILTPLSTVGTIWALGPHRLMCGSATVQEDVLALTGGVRMDMAFTDPPYNVNYSGVGKETSNTILNDNMDEDAFRLFLQDTFASYKLILKEDAAMYVCYASLKHREFEDSLNQNGYKVKAQLIWVKTIAAWGFADYRWKHEPILYVSLGGKKVPFYGDRKNTTEWRTEPTETELLQEAIAMLQEEEREGTTVWKLNREGGGYVHPTQKPLELIEIALRNSTNKNDTVVDLFAGSGSALMACHQMTRQCFSMELDPRYVDVICNRFKLLTGIEPVRMQ